MTTVVLGSHIEERSETYLANFVTQNSTIGQLNIYQVMRARGQVETLVGIGARTKFMESGSTGR